MLRIGHRDPEYRSPGDCRAALQPVPRHGHLLTDPGRAADRPQPPRGRHGVPRRPPDGVPRLHGGIPPSAAHPAADPAGRGLQHHGGRQVAPRAARRAQPRRGPFDRWPLGLGFERYYGFLHGDTNHWTPDARARQPLRRAARHAARRAITSPRTWPTRRSGMVVDQQHAAPGKPFFLYFATGAMHAPHHVAREWSEPTGAVRRGLGALARATSSRGSSPAGVVPQGDDADAATVVGAGVGRALAPTSAGSTPACRRCSPASSRHTDAQIGRLVDGLETLGVLDDTLVMVMSDNGASAEGGAVGTINEHRFTANVPDDLGENLGRHRRAGAGTAPTTTTPGGGPGPATRPSGSGSATRGSAAPATPLIVHWPAGSRRSPVRSAASSATPST